VPEADLCVTLTRRSLLALTRLFNNGLKFVHGGIGPNEEVTSKAQSSNFSSNSACPKSTWIYGGGRGIAKNPTTFG
jgi:hypothetical protein